MLITTGNELVNSELVVKSLIRLAPWNKDVFYNSTSETSQFIHWLFKKCFQRNIGIFFTFKSAQYLIICKFEKMLFPKLKSTLVRDLILVHTNFYCWTQFKDS